MIDIDYGLEENHYSMQSPTRNKKIQNLDKKTNIDMLKEYIKKPIHHPKESQFVQISKDKNALKKNLENTFQAVTEQHIKINRFESKDVLEDAEIQNKLYKNFETDNVHLKDFVELLQKDMDPGFDEFKKKSIINGKTYLKKKKSKLDYNFADKKRLYKSSTDLVYIPKTSNEVPTNFDQNDLIEVDDLDNNMKMVLRQTSQMDFQDNDGNEPLKKICDENEQKTNKDIINGMLSGDLVDGMFDCYSMEQVYKIVQYTILRRKKLQELCMRLDKLIVIGKKRMHEANVDTGKNSGYNVKGLSNLQRNNHCNVNNSKIFLKRKKQMKWLIRVLF